MFRISVSSFDIDPIKADLGLLQSVVLRFPGVYGGQWHIECVFLSVRAESRRLELARQLWSRRSCLLQRYRHFRSLFHGKIHSFFTRNIVVCIFGVGLLSFLPLGIWAT